MNRLRDSRRDFEGAVSRTADELRLAPHFVEKDYWVTQVVRALHEHHPGGFVLKGGTSLSKGYGLISRFSEDVDILVQPSHDDSMKRREGRLEEIAEAVAGILTLQRVEARPPGRGHTPHRADVLSYPETATGGNVEAPGGPGVLLEIGFAGGEWPAEMVTMQPLLCGVLKIEQGEFEDTNSFQIRALLPARTLMEKLALLHHLATKFSEDAVMIDDRFGRHYYDIYRLLDHGPTQADLRDRDKFDRILAEMQSISARHYGGWTARPADGYAESLAFAPPVKSELRDWLQESYATAAELLPASVEGGWPEFGQILKRVEQNRELL